MAKIKRGNLIRTIWTISLLSWVENTQQKDLSLKKINRKEENLLLGVEIINRKLFLFKNCKNKSERTINCKSKGNLFVVFPVQTSL